MTYLAGVFASLQHVGAGVWNLVNSGDEARMAGLEFRLEMVALTFQ